MVLRDQEKFVFYINNYIVWDQFIQLYNLDQMKKGIRNSDAVACKLRPASTKGTNNILEVAGKKRRKSEEMMERRKVKTIAIKRRKARERISLSSEKEDENNTEYNTDLDQANKKYSLQL